ncbi:hypothetical protein BYT27DRAFT_7191619 [Phlegmacium glaucopus]|nr:hypothetical protein BYT27DRAFT_7191619 [Phlegmacium glaucopus]
MSVLLHFNYLYNDKYNRCLNFIHFFKLKSESMTLYKLKCPYYLQGSGRTNHIQSAHVNHNIITHPTPNSNQDDRDSPEILHEHPSPHEPLIGDNFFEPPDHDHLFASPPPIPNAPLPRPQRNIHPNINSQPCDEHGQFLPLGTAPLPHHNPSTNPSSLTWDPFNDQLQFQVADFLYHKVEMSAGNINELMDIWSLSKSKEGDISPFSSHEHLYATIDAIKHGDAPWKSFTISYVGDIGLNVPSWQLDKYLVFGNPDIVIGNMLANPDFDGEFDYVPFIELDKLGHQHWNEFLSGNFSWRHADTIYHNDESTKGTLYCPIILGADKTTVSVATGHVEYHPLYLCCQLYHASISKILSPLQHSMTAPVVRRCPDGHFWCVIYNLAAFIADYLEQVYLSVVVQGWCPRCTALPNDLDSLCGQCTRAFTKDLIDELDSKTLWDEYGIDNDILPFTYDFPCADIHEILTPDLLHQIIKGMFKDHLVTWVQESLVVENGESHADEILDDIDRRIAAIPLFPNLRRFPHGRRFKQWTGDDSKALMKVYVAAISDITEATLATFNNTLAKFYTHHEIFQCLGVRPDGFSLPHQHALSHYHHLIQEFGTPGGICSSITESRHIIAVKKPWQHSNHYEALSQMLLINQCLDKLGAAYFQPQKISTAHRSRNRDNNREDSDFEIDEDTRSGTEMVEGNVVLTCTHTDGVELEDCPKITSKILVFHSAVATFFAPSDECGLMSCPLWWKKASRQDCALVVENKERPGMKGMNIMQVQLFFSFHHNEKMYPCALVEWFSTAGWSHDSTTDMWKGGYPLTLPVFGSEFLPINFHYTQSLDAFQAYYVNHFADHHSHEIIF